MFRFFYVQFFGWLGCLFVPSIQVSTGNWVGVWDLRSEKVCWAAAITYIIHFKPVLVCCFCAFHGFFIYVTIYHVHMIVPFPVMYNIYSTLFIACTVCPVWRNWWQNMKLVLQLGEEWTCSLNLVETDCSLTYIYI